MVARNKKLKPPDRRRADRQAAEFNDLYGLGAEVSVQLATGQTITGRVKGPARVVTLAVVELCGVGCVPVARITAAGVSTLDEDLEEAFAA